MKYYLTTPIYYVNAAPHIGHAYTTIAADTIARFKRMQGYEAVVTSGTDEHGQKVERSAKAAGKSPEEFTTIISNEFREQWKQLDLDIDRFQRTTSPSHARVVQDLFKRCLENGYIYKGSYTGQYCVYDELYVSDAQPGDPCPDCGRITETVTEENYFFKLSAFTEKLIAYHEEHPEFLQPDTRRNEVFAFLRQGLSDLSISRTTIKWGIPLPVEGNHVFYVWFDALATYMSAVEGEGLWPADLHLIGKEIVRFHAIYWPAFLMAAELPLPKKIFAHGWLLFENDKMSKSRGNIVRATPLSNVMGIDALRYFLLREVVFGQDGSFSFDALVTRYNADLANGLGNLASRTLNMIEQYRQGHIPGGQTPRLVQEVAETAIADYKRAFEKFEFSKGIEAVWSLFSFIDKYIVQSAPWKLAKNDDENAQSQLEETLYTAAEALRIGCVLLHPVIPHSVGRIWKQLGMTEPLEEFELRDLRWGQLESGQSIGQIGPVFPRIDAKVAIEKMKELETEETARQQELMGKKPAAAANTSEVNLVAETPAQEATAPTAAATGVAPPSEKIAIDDFSKVDLRVGQVLSAERLKGSDKLLHLKVDIGEPEPRTILAGIALAYQPEQLLNRKVVIVANLLPRKMRGVESNGMIVAASLEGGSPVLAGFLEDVPVGARLK